MARYVEPGLVFCVSVNAIHSIQAVSILFHLLNTLLNTLLNALLIRTPS